MVKQVGRISNDRPAEPLHKKTMTVTINSLNTTSRRCYNDDAVQAALERAIQRRKASKSANWNDDNATIRELGKLRGKEREAETWIRYNMGSPESFLKAIGANAKRVARLFGNAPVR
jgi:hypothetical protein